MLDDAPEALELGGSTLGDGDRSWTGPSMPLLVRLRLRIPYSPVLRSTSFMFSDFVMKVERAKIGSPPDKSSSSESSVSVGSIATAMGEGVDGA